MRANWRGMKNVQVGGGVFSIFREDPLCKITDDKERLNANENANESNETWT